MRAPSAQALVTAGAAIAVLGGLAFAANMTPTVTPAMAYRIVRGVLFAAPIAVGAALMGAGAVLARRRARRGEHGASIDVPAVPPVAAPRELADGGSIGMDRAPRAKVDARGGG